MAIADHITQRVDEKKADYSEYAFSQVQSIALNTYFDLAQEFVDLEDVYQVAVAIPKSFFDLEARLYVIDPSETRLALVSSTADGPEATGNSAPDYVKPSEQPYSVENSMILTIRGNKQLMEELPFTPQDDVIGILEIYPYDSSDKQKELFFEKYANRIGFSMHMRFLHLKNMEHLKFIQSLVADIEHNVIVPNMIYKLYLRRLGGKISKNREIEEFCKRLTSAPNKRVNPEVLALLAELSEVNLGLEEEFGNIQTHYQSSSLFLETLLRKSHFDEGRLTPHTRECNMKEAVIAPQLERYSARLANKGIEIIDQYGETSEEETVSVDIGLMAQVFGNLFSNALKYTQQVTTDEGKERSYVAYGRETVRDHFRPGKNGVKYSVFSSGPPIPLEEREAIFDEGYRGSGSTDRPGTGYGLAFVKNAVEIHGGTAGCETTPHGNNFFFVLPE